MEPNMIASLLAGLTGGIKEGIEKRQEASAAKEKLALEASLKNRELDIKQQEADTANRKATEPSIYQMMMAQAANKNANTNEMNASTSEVDKLNDDITGLTKERVAIFKEYDLFSKKMNDTNTAPEDKAKYAPMAAQYEKTLQQIDDHYEQLSRHLYDKSNHKLGKAPTVVQARSSEAPLPQNEVAFNFDRAPNQVKEAWNMGGQPGMTKEQTRALVASQKASLSPKDFTAFAAAMGARFNEKQSKAAAEAQTLKIQRQFQENTSNKNFERR